MRQITKRKCYHRSAGRCLMAFKSYVFHVFFYKNQNFAYLEPYYKDTSCCTCNTSRINWCFRKYFRVYTNFYYLQKPKRDHKDKSFKNCSKLIWSIFYTDYLPLLTIRLYSIIKSKLSKCASFAFWSYLEKQVIIEKKQFFLKNLILWVLIYYRSQTKKLIIVKAIEYEDFRNDKKE